MIRDFDNWNDLKKKLDERNHLPHFKEGEIWWCSIGINIGSEENGKGKFFNRPTLILRKFNQNIFLGLPLTTKIKNNKFYHAFTFDGNESCAMLSQIKLFESKRLSNKLGQIFDFELQKIKEKIREII